MTMSNNNYKKEEILPVEGSTSNAVFIVGSVANEEYALASLIEAQANIICNVIKSCANVCDFVDTIQSITRALKTIVQKNNILEVKLRETLNFINKEGIDCLDFNGQFEFLNNLNSVLESIGEEEYSLSYLIDKLGEGLANVEFYSDFEDIKKIDNMVVALMKLIVEINMILLRKLRTVISLIRDIKCSDFDIFIKIKKELLHIIKNSLIESIFKEEKSLAKLIHAESIKLTEALKLCLNNEELSELNPLLISFINVVCSKRRILEYKLSETITLLNIVGFDSCEIDSVMDYIKEIQGIAYEKELELSKLIKRRAKKVNKIIGEDCRYSQESINFNSCITCTLNTLILNLNISGYHKISHDYDSCKCSQKSTCKKFNEIVRQNDY